MVEDKLTELALRAGAGNELAMNELLPEVISMAKANVKRELWHGSLEDKEDLIQDIMYMFLKNLKLFKGVARFTTWFDKLARNTRITNHRKTIAKCRIVVDTETPKYYTPDYDMKLYCQQLISYCNSRQWSVLNLLVQGYSYSYIASQLDMTYEGARSLARYGKKYIQNRVL